MLKVSTAITSSPKKFVNRFCLKTYSFESKDEHEKVSVNIKVLNVLDPITVPTGKKYRLPILVHLPNALYGKMILAAWQ